MQSDFGLVDIDDRPYEELVEVFGRVNPGLAAIHQEALLSSPASPAATGWYRARWMSWSGLPQKRPGVTRPAGGS